MGLLEGDDAVGQALPVVCANHPESVNKLRSAADFDTFVRDGGCSLQCSTRMPCGHSCPRSAPSSTLKLFIKTLLHSNCNIASSNLFFCPSQMVRCSLDRETHGSLDHYDL